MIIRPFRGSMCKHELAGTDLNLQIIYSIKWIGKNNKISESGNNMDLLFYPAKFLDEHFTW